MSISTYSELKSAIESWLDRDDLTNQIDTFIDMAEARHKREIRIREMQKRETLTLYEGFDAETDRFLALSGLTNTFLEMKSLRLSVESGTATRTYFPPVFEVSDDQMLDAVSSTAGRPSKFRVWSSEIEFDRMADQDYGVELRFYAQLTPLSDSNTTNALLTRAPDVYLYSSLLASAPFLMNDERVNLWEALYSDARDRLNQSEMAYRRSGPLTVRVAGSTP